MSGVGDDQLVELIYDSVFDPALWTPVMEELTRRVSGEVACMTMLDVHTGEGNGVTALVPAEVMQDYFSRWAHDNPLHEVGDPLRYVEQWRPATIRYEDWIERRLLDRSGFYNEFLRPIGADHGIMLGLALIGTRTVTMNIARPTRRDTFGDDEIASVRRWSGHLSRAVRLSQSVGISQAALDSVDQLIASTPQCLFFLDARGRVQRLSAAAEAMLSGGADLCIAGGVLTAMRSDDAIELRRLIAQAGLPGGTASSGSMLLRRRGADPRTVHVVPLGPRSSASWSSEPAIMVSVTTSPQPALPIDLRLRQQYGLTPAESRVALALMRGGTLRETADLAEVSLNTVRAQLGNIFSKTGCRRQADLVRVLLLLEQEVGGG